MGINFVLTIVGDGTELPKLKQLAKKLNIESKVSFYGKNSQIPNYPNYYKRPTFTLACPPQREYPPHYLKLWQHFATLLLLILQAIRAGFNIDKTDNLVQCRRL